MTLAHVIAYVTAPLKEKWLLTMQGLCAVSDDEVLDGEGILTDIVSLLFEYMFQQTTGNANQFLTAYRVACICGKKPHSLLAARYPDGCTTSAWPTIQHQCMADHTTPVLKRSPHPTLCFPFLILRLLVLAVLQQHATAR